MKSIRDTLLDAGVLEKGEYTFASGKPANNKLNTDILWSRRRVLRSVVRELGVLASQFQPDLLVGIPSGGQKWAVALDQSRHCNIKAAMLKKMPSEEPGVKRFDYAFPISKQYVEQAERIVIIEDVLNARTSTYGVLNISEIAERAKGVVCIWDRGLPEEFEPLPDSLPVRALHQEPLPRLLPEDSYLMQRAVNKRENRSL